MSRLAMSHSSQTLNRLPSVYDSKLKNEDLSNTMRHPTHLYRDTDFNVLHMFLCCLAFLSSNQTILKYMYPTYVLLCYYSHDVFMGGSSD